MKNTKNYDDYAEMCGNCAFYFVATGLKCFMKLHKCVGHLLNYGAQVFLFLHIFLTFFFFVIWVAAGRWWCIFIKRLGNCPTGELGVSVSPVSCVFVGQFTHLAFGLVF